MESVHTFENVGGENQSPLPHRRGGNQPFQTDLRVFGNFVDAEPSGQPGKPRKDWRGQPLWSGNNTRQGLHRHRCDLPDRDDRLQTCSTDGLAERCDFRRPETQSARS